MNLITREEWGAREIDVTKAHELSAPAKYLVIERSESGYASSIQRHDMANGEADITFTYIVGNRNRNGKDIFEGN